MKLVKSPTEWADRILEHSAASAVQAILDDWTWPVRYQDRLKFADDSGFTLDGFYVPLHLLYHALARCATTRIWPDPGRIDLERGSLVVSQRNVEYMRVGNFCSAHVDGGLFRVCPIETKNELVVRNSRGDSAAGNMRNELSSERFERQKSAKIIRLNLIGKSTATQGETMSDTENGRGAQFLAGGKTGLKKGAIKVVSEKAAQKVVSALPIPAKKPVERIAQLGLLMGAAELLRQMPDKVGSKIGLTKERLASFGCEAYEMSGEIVGRDAVDLAQYFAPMFAETLKQLAQQGVSAEDIANAAVELDEQNKQEEEAAAASAVSTPSQE